MSTSCCKRAGNNRVSPSPLTSRSSPSACANRAGARAAHTARIGKQPEQDPAMKPIVLGRRIEPDLLHRHAEGLDQLAILHARWAGRFAAAAIQAQLQMPPHIVRQRQPAVGHAAHQIDSPARAVVFVAGLQIRGTRRSAKPAMDAIQKPADSRSPRRGCCSRQRQCHSWRAGIWRFAASAVVIGNLSVFYRPKKWPASSSVNETPGIEQAARIKLLFDAIHPGERSAGPAPDTLPRQIADSAGQHDHVASGCGHGRLQAADQFAGQIVGREAGKRGQHDAVAGVGLDAGLSDRCAESRRRSPSRDSTARQP